MRHQASIAADGDPFARSMQGIEGAPTAPPPPTDESRVDGRDASPEPSAPPALPSSRGALSSNQGHFGVPPGPIAPPFGGRPGYAAMDDFAGLASLQYPSVQGSG